MKKILAILLVLVMVMSLVACDSDTPGSKDSGNGGSNVGNSDDGYKIAVVTDYGDITDRSFNQTTYEVCKAFADENSIPFNYYKPSGDTTAEREAMVDAAVADGYNIIVLPGFAFGETLAGCADAYPNVKFIALDVADGEGGFHATENVYSAVYQEELAGYMAGYAAVKMGYKHLGFLGGMAVPSVQRFGYGFLQGVDDAAAELNITGEVVVEYVYGGVFQGDADITAYMDAWYGEKGVEVVFACGGGIFTSAAEAAVKVGGKIIGVDSDQAPVIDGMYLAEGMTITSAMKGVAPTVKDTLTAIVLENKWADYAGKIETLGLVSEDPTVNYVQLPMQSTQWCDTFAQDDYKALVASLFDGTVTVSNDITAMPATAVAVNQYDNIK